MIKFISFAFTNQYYATLFYLTFLSKKTSINDKSFFYCAILSYSPILSSFFLNFKYNIEMNYLCKKIKYIEDVKTN